MWPGGVPAEVLRLQAQVVQETKRGPSRLQLLFVSNGLGDKFRSGQYVSMSLSAAARVAWLLIPAQLQILAGIMGTGPTMENGRSICYSG